MFPLKSAYFWPLNMWLYLRVGEMWKVESRALDCPDNSVQKKKRRGDICAQMWDLVQVSILSVTPIVSHLKPVCVCVSTRKLSVAVYSHLISHVRWIGHIQL